MADVKWIKIVTDVFDNRKIKLIRKMPEGAELVVTWFQLLCLAGETNDNGLIYVTRTIPYTEETLATAFDTPLPIVRLALETFKNLEMINIYDDFLCISNWEKYQNCDALEKIREKTRNRVANHRAKQKELSGCNVTVTLPVTHCNATDKELELDKELEVEREVTGDRGKSKRFAPPTLDEVKAECMEKGHAVDPEAFFDYYTGNGWMAGKVKMKDWKATLRNWNRRESTGGKTAVKKSGNIFLDMLEERRGK